MEKKQTAVQILIESINDRNLWTKELRLEAEQALQIEREQIEEAYWDGGQDIPIAEQTCKDYYIRTFKP